MESTQGLFNLASGFESFSYRGCDAFIEKFKFIDRIYGWLFWEFWFEEPKKRDLPNNEKILWHRII